MGATTWTEAAADKAALLWSEGRGATAIAAELGGGLTRMAVIGKMTRMGVPCGGPPNKGGRPHGFRPRSVTGKERQMRHRILRADDDPRPPPSASIPAGAPPSKSLTIMQLTSRTCRWPYGTTEITFCGHRAVDGASYCEFHRRLGLSPYQRPL